MQQLLLTTLNGLQHLAKQHPRRIMLSAGFLLFGAGVTAFGLVPDSAQTKPISARQIVESVDLQPALIDASLQPNNAYGKQHMTLYRQDFVRREDTLGSLFKRLDIQDAGAMGYIKDHAQTAQWLKEKGHKTVASETNGNKRLQKITIRWAQPNATEFNELVIARTPSGFQSHENTAPVQVKTQLAAGVIQNSLFAATDAARLPDTIASQLADIFAADIDFRRDLRKGDRFTLVYEALMANGELIGHGRILGAEFINHGRVLQSMWFQESGKKGDYYTFDGKTRRRSYLASPVEFSRISSGYGMRFHPISGREKPHLGLDFAAPTGTPVRTVGDGVVEFAGVQNGYGNMIVVNHQNNQSTAYAHLSRINVQKGQTIEQGTLIGLVGSTGSSTGPHLHFEFRDHGVHQDPMILAAQGQSNVVSTQSAAVFGSLASRMKSELQMARDTRLASAE